MNFACSNINRKKDLNKKGINQFNLFNLTRTKIKKMQENFNNTGNIKFCNASMLLMKYVKYNYPPL